MNGFRPVPRPIAEAQGEVQTIARNINPVVVDQKAQVDEGVLGPELIQVLEQPSVGEGAIAPDRDDLLDLALLQPIKSRSDPLECFGEHGHEHQPFVRQGKTPRQSRSTRLLLIRRRRSMRGCLDRNSSRCWSNHPLAKVLLHPTVTTSSIWPCSSRSRVAPIRSNASVSTGMSTSPSSVKARPRGNLRNRLTPSISSRPFT